VTTSLPPPVIQLSKPGPYTLPEGCNVAATSKGSKPSVVRRGRPVGRPRMARSMGRYPFLAYANRYLETVAPMYAEATVKELGRRYRRMAMIFAELSSSGRTDTDNPIKMGEKEILAYIERLKADGVKESGLAHNLSALGSLLLDVNNTSLERVRKRYPSLMPKRRNKRQAPIESDVVGHILKASQNVKEWRTLEAYAVVVTALSTGLRPKELRLSTVMDLDTKRWVLNVKHVKGESTYGEQRDVPIRVEGQRLIERYINARAEIVKERCPGNEALFPAADDHGDGYFAPNSIARLKTLVERDIGSKFELRACRRTFGQTCIDEGLPIESVSLLLGHSTTKTTETYYCRKRQDAAIKEAQSLWNGQRPAQNPTINEPALKQKSALIENKNWMTGYA